jgi:hypothetical protein
MRTLAVMCAAAIHMMPLAGCVSKNKFEEGFTWDIADTAKLTGLTITDGVVIKAPVGYKVTMTVGDAAKVNQAGTCKGKIVHTVTND